MVIARPGFRVRVSVRMAGVGERDDDRHGWGPLLDDLEKRQARARAMGGRERIERQHARGRLDARERCLRLFDPGSFTELGALVGGVREPGEPDTPADALVAGMGRIEGRPALAWSEDVTVLGGSIGQAATAKRYRLCQLAAQERVPLVTMLEGAGHRLTEAMRSQGRAPNDLQGLAELSGEVPLVCLVMGASAGHSALAAPLSDFTIMTESACMFTGGPPLVKAALGEDVTKEELGGVKVHVEQSGVAHNAAPDDEAALDMARRYLSYFPLHRGQPAPRRTGPDAAPRPLDEILRIVPADDRRPYDMHGVLEILVDEASLFEVQPRFGRAVITALAFLGGRSVAIVANNPAMGAGSIDSDGAGKAADFLDVAGVFSLPVVFLADNPGVMAGTKAERSGILKHAGRMFAAQHRLRAPKLHVTLRKAFGFGSSSMAMNPFDGQSLSLAFPGLTLGAMPAASGGRSAKLDDRTQEQVETEQAGGPYRSAHSMAYDDVIDPRELRNALIAGLGLSEGREGGA